MPLFKNNRQLLSRRSPKKKPRLKSQNGGRATANKGSKRDGNGGFDFYKLLLKLTILMWFYIVYNRQQLMLAMNQDTNGTNNNKQTNGKDPVVLRGNAAAAPAGNARPKPTPAKPVAKPGAIRVFPDMRNIDFHFVLRHLLREAARAFETTGTKLHLMEVGSQTPLQCIHMALTGNVAHCMEADESFLPKIKNGVEGGRMRDPEMRQNVRLYHKAADRVSGNTLELANGRVVTRTPEEGKDAPARVLDSWTMERQIPDANQINRVETATIDDMLRLGGSESKAVLPTFNYKTGGVAGAIDRIFLLEMDVHGYEPAVFEGLQKSIEKKLIDLILFNYWPKGIDNVFHSGTGEEKKCSDEALKMLEMIRDAGYTLFSGNMHFHPKAELSGDRKREIHQHNTKPRTQNLIQNVPLQPMEICMIFYDLETSSPNYKMGFWTDFLAVKPGFQFPHNFPVTKAGEILATTLANF